MKNFIVACRMARATGRFLYWSSFCQVFFVDVANFPFTPDVERIKQF